VNLEFGFLARSRPDQPSSRADVERLEALGIDSLWSAGHISNGRAVPEAVVGAALLAGQTERVRIGTAVVLAPLYHPVIVAKQFAELDRATGGRMMLGVGVGGEYPDEFQALQTPLTERGARTDEAIGVLKRLWSGGAVGNDGPTWPFDPISIDPPPVQPGGPPVIVAGRKAPAMRRAAASGDGWMPFLYSPTQYAASVETVRGHAVSIGRDLGEFAWMCFVFVSVDDDAAEARRKAVSFVGNAQAGNGARFESMIDHVAVAGTPDQVAARLSAFADAGAGHFVITVCDTDPVRGAERVMRDVVPEVRRAHP
jgi:alkanesulfonate monooxygenase SsuD/methylene tetrahydromethanopterin reductase-like flavin-dependent oxidoreductase (luciferase family)